MYLLSRSSFLAVALAVLAIPSFTCAIGISGPLSLDDLRQLRRDGLQPKEIVAIAQRRGLSFTVNPVAERSLRTLGFRKSMIETLRDTVTNLESDVGPKAPTEKEAPEDKPPVTANPREEAWHSAYAVRVQTMIAASGLQLGVSLGNGITLVADASATAKYRAMIQQVEGMIRRNFPPPLGTGPDRRSSYIVLLRTDSDYHKWVRAMFAVNARAGIPGHDAVQLNAALQSAGTLPRGMSVVNLSKTGSWSRRTIAFNLGFLYMQGVTNNRAPAALLSGFGNVSESNIDGNPHVVLGAVSYADSHLPTQSGSRWLGMLKQLFAARRVDSIEQLLTYRISAMEEIHYAESWSLTQLLANDPVRFSKLLGAIRDGQPAIEAVRVIYEADDQQLLASWGKLIAKAN